MTTLDYILIGIGALILLPFLLATFGPNSFEIVREIVINRSKQEVFDYVKILRNSERFNKWVMTDPKMKKEFRGTDGTVGFIYGWDSENKSVGKGEQEIKKITEGTRIDYELRFKKPFEGTSSAWIIMEALSEKQTKVIWVFAGNNTYIMKVMHIVLNLKKALGKDLQMSLNNLKSILEK